MREHTYAALRPLAWCGLLLIVGSVLLGPARAEVEVERARRVRTSAYVLRGFRWNGQVVRVAIVTATGERGIRLSMAGERFGERRTTSAIGTSARASAAVNGGFTLAGTGAPRHLTVIRGEIITSGVLPTQPGTVLMMTADGTRAWVGRPRFEARVLSSSGAGFTIQYWNARQPGPERAVAFTARGGSSVRPALESCYALLRPLEGSSTWERRYEVVAVRGSEACDGAPMRPPQDRFDWVVLGGGPVGELAVGDDVTMEIDLGHPGVTDAFGGIPRLVRFGQNVGPACRETCGSRHGPDPPFYRRNPRTAVGITRGCRDADPASICRYFLVTVDGRQPDWSRGVRFPALGALLVELGAWDALNLDGGGSTTMWVRPRNSLCQHRTAVGCVVNRPAYWKQREVIDAVVSVPVGG